jgi:hypothetical protein
LDTGVQFLCRVSNWSNGPAESQQAVCCGVHPAQQTSAGERLIDLGYQNILFVTGVGENSVSVVLDRLGLGQKGININGISS